MATRTYRVEAFLKAAARLGPEVTVGADDDPALIGERLNYPCVVKPLALSASRGVIRANNPAEFEAAFGEVADILSEAGLEPDDPAAHQLLVEEFIPGREVALEGLLVNG